MLLCCWLLPPSSPHRLRWVQSRPSSLHIVPLGAMKEEGLGLPALTPWLKGLPPTLPSQLIITLT